LAERQNKLPAAISEDCMLKIKYVKIAILAGRWWLQTVILASWEAEIWRIAVTQGKQFQRSHLQDN
jgi:hypothetical protein